MEDQRSVLDTVLGFDPVFVNIGNAADKIERGVNEASQASERYTKSLVHATRALVFVTAVLAVITAGLLYVALNPPG